MLHRSTNYSVVDIELINELYATEYQEMVRGPRRLFMRRASEITSAVARLRIGIEVAVRSNLDGSPTRSSCDALILATGFTPAPARNFVRRSRAEIRPFRVT